MIGDVTQKNDRKVQEPNRIDNPYSFASHWSTQHPTKFKARLTTPLPALSDGSTLIASHQSTQKYQQSSIARRRSDQPHLSTTVDQSTEAHFSGRHDLDLGVASSQDSRRSQHESKFENNNVAAEQVKIPSGQYSTPLLQPQYNYNYNTSKVPSTTASSSVSFRTTTTSAPIKSSTSNSLSRAPTKQVFHLPGKPFATHISSTVNSVPIKKSTNKDFSTGTTKSTQKNTNNDGRILSRPHQSIDSTSFPPNNSPAPSPSFVPILGNHGDRGNLPSNDLLPPFESLHIYDDSTTQGPPIYYEWKIPASALEPPLVGRRTPSNPISTSTEQSTTAIHVPANGLQPPLFTDPTNQFRNNPFVSFALATSITSETQQTSTIDHKSPTPRSIPLDLSSSTVDDADISMNHLKVKDNNYLELKKSLLIPDYTFPLELDPAARISYDKGDSLNSFQIRIPSGRGGAQHAVEVKENQPAWYGENAECPECHPSFVKPGTCEPCIKIR